MSGLKNFSQISSNLSKLQSNIHKKGVEGAIMKISAVKVEPQPEISKCMAKNRLDDTDYLDNDDYGNYGSD